MKVHEALSKVMADVGAVKKNDRNTQSNYNFRGVDAVTSAVYPALIAHGVIVVPKVLDYQYGTVVVGQKRTEMSHVRLTVQFTWIGPEGDALESVAAGEAFDSGDKATPKAHSVAFRIAILQTLCLPTDEADPDSNTYERSEVAAAQPAPSNAEGIEALTLACKERQMSKDNVAALFKREFGCDPKNASTEDLKAFAALIKEGAYS